MPQPLTGPDIACGADLKSESTLERVLADGHFAVTAEMVPPKGMDTELVKRKVGQLKGCVDAANVTDNQTGIVRLSSIATGIICMQEGLEPVGGLELKTVSTVH